MSPKSSLYYDEGLELLLYNIVLDSITLTLNGKFILYIFFHLGKKKNHLTNLGDFLVQSSQVLSVLIFQFKNIKKIDKPLKYYFVLA